MHRQAGTLFLFTYAKIPHVCVRTYPLKIQNLRYGSSILYASQPLAQLPRRGPVPKLLWADLLLFAIVYSVHTYTVMRTPVTVVAATGFATEEIISLNSRE